MYFDLKKNEDNDVERITTAATPQNTISMVDAPHAFAKTPTAPPVTSITNPPENPRNASSEQGRTLHSNLSPSNIETPLAIVSQESPLAVEFSSAAPIKCSIGRNDPLARRNQQHFEQSKSHL